MIPICQGADAVFQKSVHAGIEPTFELHGRTPCLSGVQRIIILYPWRFG